MINLWPLWEWCMWGRDGQREGERERERERERVRESCHCHLMIMIIYRIVSPEMIDWKEKIFIYIAFFWIEIVFKERDFRDLKFHSSMFTFLLFASFYQIKNIVEFFKYLKAFFLKCIISIWEKCMKSYFKI